MEQNIYDLLNEMDQQVEQYETENVTAEELKSWKKAFNKKRMQGQTKHAGKQFRYVAACAVLLMGCIALRNPVSARMSILTYHIQELMGNTKDLSDYSTAVNKEVTKDGVTVSVGDVIIDEDCMYVAYTVKDLNQYMSEDERMGTSVDAMVYVNGVRASFGSRGGMRPRKNTSDVDTYMMELDLNKNYLEKENHYKLVFTRFDGKHSKRVGAVSFVASGVELQKAMKTSEINHVVNLKDAGEITFVEYVANPVQQRINVMFGEETANYDITLRGEDNLGRELQFYLAVKDGNQGKMVLYYLDNDTLLDNAKNMEGVTSFTVTPYAQKYPEKSGKMDEPIEQIGEPFTIDVK